MVVPGHFKSWIPCFYAENSLLVEFSFCVYLGLIELQFQKKCENWFISYISKDGHLFFCMEGYTIVGKICEWFSFVWEVGCLLSVNSALKTLFWEIRIQEACNQKTYDDYFMNFCFIIFLQTCWMFLMNLNFILSKACPCQVQ